MSYYNSQRELTALHDTDRPRCMIPTSAGVIAGLDPAIHPLRKYTFNATNVFSSMKKVDAHIIQPEEYDEAPIRKRGRPALGDAVKVPSKLRLSPDVLERDKAIGKGWQTRMQEDITKTARRLKTSSVR